MSSIAHQEQTKSFGVFAENKVRKTRLGVIARSPSRIPAGVRERVEVIEGSHGDADVVNQAFAGAGAVFWVVPPDRRAKGVEAAYIDFTQPACDALKKHRVKRVVGSRRRTSCRS